MILRILSVASAIILWFAVTYSEDPAVEIPVSNISVKLIGEKALEKNGLIFVNREELPNPVIDVRGRRSEVRSILNSVSASIDLSDIAEAGEYTKDVSYDVPNTSVMISKKRVSSVTVKVEKAETKEIPLKVLQSGSNKDYIVKSTPSELKIKISGTGDDLAKISSATVPVDISEMQKDNTGEYQPIYNDRNGNTVTPSNRIMHEGTGVTVKNEVYVRKTVRIELSPKYSGEDYHIEVKSFSTDKLEVGVKDGNAETLYASFKPGTEINGDGKYEMVLEIPENVYCPQLPELVMTASIENVVTKTVFVPVECVNTPQGLAVTVIPEGFNVTATGTEKSIEELKATVDLSDIEEGEHTLPARFDGNATVEGDWSVSVKAWKKAEN